MTSKKLYSLIELIKKQRNIPSINEFGRLAEEKEICTRMTVFNLLPKIQDHESVDFKIVDGQDTFTYVDVTKRSDVMEKGLDDVDSIIKDCEIFLKEFKNLPKKIHKDEKLKIIDRTIAKKRKIIKAQQRMVHFDACGYRTIKTKERFDQTKDKLSKIDLAIHKKVFNIDRETVGNMWIRISQIF